MLCYSLPRRYEMPALRRNVLREKDEEMNAPESYPFYRISKMYDLPYGDVLMYAKEGR